MKDLTTVKVQSDFMIPENANRMNFWILNALFDQTNTVYRQTRRLQIVNLVTISRKCGNYVIF